MKKELEKRRRRAVIDKDFQSRFTMKFSLVASVFLVAYAGLLLYTVKTSYEMLIQSALIQIPTMVVNLQREFRVVSLLLVANFVFIVLFLIGFGLVFSQKLAGPLLALQNRLKELAQGKKDVRMHLRRNDEFKSLETAFNLASTAIDAKRISLNQSLEEIKQLISSKATDEALKKVESLLESKTL